MILLYFGIFENILIYFEGICLYLIGSNILNLLYFFVFYCDNCLILMLKRWVLDLFVLVWLNYGLSLIFLKLELKIGIFYSYYKGIVFNLL